MNAHSSKNTDNHDEGDALLDWKRRKTTVLRRIQYSIPEIESVRKAVKWELKGPRMQGVLSRLRAEIVYQARKYTDAPETDVEPTPTKKVD
jgi:hypothetical protein